MFINRGMGVNQMLLIQLRTLKISVPYWMKHITNLYRIIKKIKVIYLHYI
jgi:hypothetical protein